MAEWQWPGTAIAAVVDGDTVDALLIRDLGFGGWSTLPMRLRLNRINVPPSKTPIGLQAAARVRDATNGVLVHVTTVKSYKYGGPEGKLAEYMAEIILPDGRNLSDDLVSAGLAVYWDGAGPRPGG
jgi:endonuclease YncB( thermonuclease family)